MVGKDENPFVEEMQVIRVERIGIRKEQIEKDEISMLEIDCRSSLE